MEVEKLSSVSLCSLSSVDDSIQKEINFIENVSQSSSFICTQLYMDDQLTSYNASLFLDFSLDFSKSEITKEANQNYNSNSDEIIQLPQKITNFPSRLDRTKTKRNLVLDINQTKITNFVEICERIKQHVNECEEISQEFVSNLRLLDEKKYYAVYYNNTFYIERVMEIFENSTKIKFLKSELDVYKWLKETDIQIVQNEYLFFGPVTLIENEPFYLNGHEKILVEKRYKELKRIYNN